MVHVTTYTVQEGRISSPADQGTLTRQHLQLIGIILHADRLNPNLLEEGRGEVRGGP
jgi:hypothetical protein